MFSTLCRLTSLEITRSPSVDDTVAQALAENCPCLKVLNINRTSIGDEGMRAFADNQLALTGLDISYTKVIIGNFFLISLKTNS